MSASTLKWPPHLAHVYVRSEWSILTCPVRITVPLTESSRLRSAERIDDTVGFHSSPHCGRLRGRACTRYAGLITSNIDWRTSWTRSCALTIASSKRPRSGSVAAAVEPSSAPAALHARHLQPPAASGSWPSSARASGPSLPRSRSRPMNFCGWCSSSVPSARSKWSSSTTLNSTEYWREPICAPSSRMASMSAPCFASRKSAKPFSRSLLENCSKISFSSPHGQRSSPLMFGAADVRSTAAAADSGRAAGARRRSTRLAAAAR